METGSVEATPKYDCRRPLSGGGEALDIHVFDDSGHCVYCDEPAEDRELFD